MKGKGVVLCGSAVWECCVVCGEVSLGVFSLSFCSALVSFSFCFLLSLFLSLSLYHLSVCPSLSMAQRDAFAWFEEIPFVSKVYLTASLALTTACFLDFLSPLALYYNFDLIFGKGQYWRLFTSFFFFGTFSLDFLFHVYFVIRYCRLLEEGIFRGRTADMVVMLIFGAALITTLATTVQTFSKIKFLGQPLAFMMVYVWGRSPENADIRMGFLGVFPFSAPYLPWILLLFSICIGNPVETDLLGIIVGHIYYFLEFVYPVVSDLRGWRVKRILCTPSFLHYLFGSDNIHGYGGMFAPARINPVEQAPVVQPEVREEENRNQNQEPEAHPHQD